MEKCRSAMFAVDAHRTATAAQYPQPASVRLEKDLLSVALACRAQAGSLYRSVMDRKRFCQALRRVVLSTGERSVVEVRLPVPIDRDHIDASYGDGFLRVSLPKAQPRQISVTT